MWHNSLWNPRPDSHGDVPKWLKGPHSKCGRRVTPRESSNLSISATSSRTSYRSRRLFYKKSSLIHSVAPPFQIEPAALGFDLVYTTSCCAIFNKFRWYLKCRDYTSRSKLYIACSDLSYQSERAHFSAPRFQNAPADAGVRIYTVGIRKSLRTKYRSQRFLCFEKLRCYDKSFSGRISNKFVQNAQR